MKPLQSCLLMIYPENDRIKTINSMIKKKS